MDAVGRPEVTLWTQLASLCLTPVAVVIGVHWGIEGVAVCFVVCQLIAVEIPMFIIVLRADGRFAAGPCPARLSGVAAASLVMAVACLLGRSALEAAGVGMAGRAALTIGLGIGGLRARAVVARPAVSRRVVEIASSRLRNLINVRRRRPVLQT